MRKVTTRLSSIGSCFVLFLFILINPVRAKSLSLSKVSDQANDGDFCKTIYSCLLSPDELSLLKIEDNQAYQIKDHTGTYSNGVWPQIYFAPDRYVEFSFEKPNLSPDDIILASNIIIVHKTNSPLGLKEKNYDIILNTSTSNGQTWEKLSSNLWPGTSSDFSTFVIPLPKSYLNPDYLNNFKIRLSLFGDDGLAGLSSVIDLVKMDIDYYNSQSNTPPTNTINSPEENKELKGEMTFSVSVTDDFGISEYQLNLLDNNSNLITTCLQATIASTINLSINCQINTNNYSDGQYKLQVKSKDNAGEWSQAERQVSFNNTSSTATTQISTTSPTISPTTTNNQQEDLATLIDSTIKPAFSSPYSYQPIEPKSYNLPSPISTNSPLQETKVLGQTTTNKPKTWMLTLSIFLSISYLIYLLSRRP